ncbi:MAG: SDR family NAD(P)-dependent oxidoreductase [Acidimicrobiales bacterium]
MDLGLNGGVAVVTGGASNIGRAIALELAAEGARVVIADRDAAMSERTVADITAAGGDATAIAVDLTETALVEEAVHAIETDVGPIVTLVNNVGWNGTAGFFLDIEPERWERAYQLNLATTFAATRAVLPGMVERRRGAIVSIASDAGFGQPRVSDYGAMKAGVMAFTRSIAQEYGRFGIRANTVCPGLVVPDPADIGEHSLWQDDAGMDDRAVAAIEGATPLRVRPEAVDIAWTVAFLASDRARRLTGQVMSVSGGFVMPR